MSQEPEPDGVIGVEKVKEIIKSLSTKDLQELYYELGIMLARRTKRDKTHTVRT